MDWFLYEIGLRRETLKYVLAKSLTRETKKDKCCQNFNGMLCSFSEFYDIL